MYQHKIGARAEYRAQESQRVKDSPSLAKKFRRLKSLMVRFTTSIPEHDINTSAVKYAVNIDHARSVFRLNCPNSECVRGDFDLTEELAAAVVARRTTVTGELSCLGWRNKTTIDTIHCHSILRYTLRLAY